MVRDKARIHFNWRCSQFLSFFLKLIGNTQTVASAIDNCISPSLKPWTIWRSGRVWECTPEAAIRSVTLTHTPHTRQPPYATPSPQNCTFKKGPLTVPRAPDKHWHFGPVVRLWRPHVSLCPEDTAGKIRARKANINTFLDLYCVREGLGDPREQKKTLDVFGGM